MVAPVADKAQAELFAAEAAGEDAIVVNDRCIVRVEGEQRAVVVAGMVVAHFVAGERMSETHAMVNLVEQGWADQKDVARAFGCTARTVRRAQRRYEEGGLPALGRTSGYPKGRARSGSRDRAVGRLKAGGLSNRAIAHRLGIDEKSVRKRLRRLGWVPQKEAEQLALVLPDESTSSADPNLSAPATSPVETPSVPAQQGADPNMSAFAIEPEPVVRSADDDPAHRRWDRLFAYLGLLDDAAPLFRPGTRVPGAGVLLAVPALVHSGIFACARTVYGSIGPAFYGLRTTILTLLLMALLRIKRPEALKENSPEDLGRILGLDRAPEVKTLRRKLTRLAAHRGGAELSRLLAERRVATRGNTLGFLYLDGHVRVYHGQRELPKAHVARMRIALPATTDYWLGDQHGDPLLCVTAQANASLHRMLPPILSDVRKLVGERRVTIVFDRGGWSPKLFDQLIRQGFDILTYRKGRFRRVPRSHFREHTGTFDGRTVRYQLADQGIHLLGGALRLRQVTRLKDGHQTSIATSRRDLSAVEVAYRMFARWRQENFFKYMREEFLLDALVDYQIEPDDPMREVPNPKWADLDTKLHRARDEIADLQRQIGADTTLQALGTRAPAPGRPKIDRALARKLGAACKRVIDLERQRARIPRRIPVGDRTDGQVIKLATERKHLTNLIKMVAYQTESDLYRSLALHYRRNEDEGRTLVQTALASAADIEVTSTELRVTLTPLSSAHRTRAIAALCREINTTTTVFPGTQLRLRYDVAAPR